jgi:hypothetical protein
MTDGCRPLYADTTPKLRQTYACENHNNMTPTTGSKKAPPWLAEEPSTQCLCGCRRRLEGMEGEGDKHRLQKYLYVE